MSSKNSPSAALTKTHLPSESDCSQRLPDMDAAHQVKLRERQCFFEEISQHDVNVHLSSAHLCIPDYGRPPVGSSSSMEVHVDLHDLHEASDTSDLDLMDRFSGASGDEGILSASQPGNNNNDGQGRSIGLFRHVLEALDAKSCGFSTSSMFSSDNANGEETPIIALRDEDLHASTAK